MVRDIDGFANILAPMVATMPQNFHQQLTFGMPSFTLRIASIPQIMA